ncbi:hypothetical protein ABZY20_18890 [Streptomyces sp. NPDC006624]|uniref:hypothetical protein n=1 Tax=Streptomyces sp. NPDC006624 TaxID=3154892 RepID=UPI0033A04895
MGAPPQRRLNAAQRAERAEKVFRLKLSGLPERRIADAIGLSQSQVNKIVAQEAARRVGPVADEFVAMRDAELTELWRRVFATMTAAGDADGRLRAVDRLVKINESRRRLRGADAPEALSVQLDRRLDQETEAVTAAVLAALKVLRVEGERRTAALEAAAAVLGGQPEPEPLPPAPATCTPYVADGGLYIDGPGGLRYRVVAEERIPSPVVAQLALPPGPSRPTAQQRDDADAVLDAVAEFEQEFGPLDEDDDADGTGGTGPDDPYEGGTAGTGTGDV